MKNFLLAIVFLLPLASLGHDSERADLGSVGRLMSDTYYLDSEVRYSGLPYSVKDYVSRFVTDVSRLGDCVRYASPYPGGVDQQGCPARCEYELTTVQRDYEPVSYYLRDTKYSYPRVYYEYENTSRALYAIRINQPQPQQTYQCVAQDSGWEEHWGGHSGVGYTQYEAHNSAMAECRRHHGKCVVKSCQITN